MLLSGEHLSINFGSRQLLEDVNFYLNQGDKTGIIGVNGTGKSTFLRVLAGELEPDKGTISTDPNVQISFLPQNPLMQDEATVLEQVFLRFPPEFRALKEYEAKTMLTKLGFSEFSRKVATLSGGERKRVALAAALIHPADILILDEPTNHLDTGMTAWLEEWLEKFRGGLILVTHDRYFLQRVVNHITELSGGKLYHYTANYSRYLELKEQRMEMLQASERKRQAILRREREWILRGCKARTTKSKERVERYERLANQQAPEAEQTLQMTGAASRLGKKLIDVENLSKSFADRTIIRDFSYHLLRDDRIGIVGGNGAGKTTLLRLIAGELAPDSGQVDMGSTVRIGHFSQEGRELDLDQRVYDFIHSVASQVRTPQGTLSAGEMMERFLFPPELQSVPIGRLSGGERRRVYLLSVLMAAPNVLILDEPTNDLDIATLSVLEDYLQEFPGPVLTVSHDRFFLDKVAQSIWELPGDGRLMRYTGNWSDWESKKKAEAEEIKFQRSRPTVQRQRERKLKFSYQEQRDFDTIDAQLADLQEQLSRCAAEQLACGSDYVRLQELTELQTRLEEQLEERTERWLYLQELKEKIDAQGE